ncbi:PRC-barrel domain-containing protein [uncultured Roseibium sp.]|uniref:PRC-barrel domain-containing protein n=1 Tax=uncultured Roseibium sp. TaxID=1936171 RepID=UPI003216FFCD
MLNAAKILSMIAPLVFGLGVSATLCEVTQAQETTSAATADATAGMKTKAVVAVPEDLVGISVVTLEGTSVGEVSSVGTDENGALSSINVDIGGFLGIGETTVTVPATDFAVSDGVIVLAKTEAEVNRLAE